MATFQMIVLTIILFVLLFSCNNVINATIGINWGRKTQVRMVPSMVVDLLLQNNIKEAKIYNTDANIIKAFAGTDIGLTITAFEVEKVSTPERAREFVKQNVVPYPTVNIKYVLIGTNIFGGVRAAKGNFSVIVNAYTYIQEALNEADKGKTKAIISNSFSGVLKSNVSTKPSEVEFMDDVKEAMGAILKVATENNAPFMYDFFPIAYCYILGIDFNFAFFDNQSNYTVKDGNVVYYNLFEYMHDSFAWALKKIGAPDDMKIVVGQIGWPTDGFPGASVPAAERYHKGLLPYVTSNKGTPMRPGAPIDVYIHSLTDEKLNPAFLSFTRHWGIYRSNGEPKYKIDLSGQGRDIFPKPAKGIGFMPGRWCVFNQDMSNQTNVKRIFDETCQQADCTSMSPGGSCSMLSFNETVSYAFNSLFQANFQSEDYCKFEGLGEITVKNPSRDGCVFNVEIVKGNLGNDNGGHGRKFKRMHVFVLVLLTFILLISFS